MISILNSHIFILVLIILQLITPYIYALIPASTIFWLCTSEILFILMPSIIYVKITNKNLKRAFSIKPLSFKSIILLIIFAILIQPSMGLLAGISSLIFPSNVNNFVNTLNTMPLIISLFISAISPAICEEIALRGAFASDYEGKNLKYIAFMNGLMFAIIHLNGEQFLYAFVMGIIFIYILKITDSIFSTILVHFTFNSSQLLLARFTATSSETAVATTESTLYVIGIYAFVTLLTLPLIYAIFKLLIKFNNKEEFIKNSFKEKLKFDKKDFSLAFFFIIVIYLIYISTSLI